MLDRFPVSSNLFNSYLRRWNDFSGHSVDSEAFLEWIKESVWIDRHWLEGHYPSSSRIWRIPPGDLVRFGNILRNS